MLPVTPEQLYALLSQCVKPILWVLPPGIDTEEKRKRLFALAGVLLGIPVMVSFVVVDVVRRDAVGALFDGGLSLLLVVCVGLLSRIKRGIIAYRIVAAGLAVDFSYNAFFVPTGDSSLIWLLIFPPVAFYLLSIPEGIYWFATLFIMNVVMVVGKIAPAADNYTSDMLPRFYVVWCIIAFLTFMFELLRWHFYDQLQKKSSALEDAMENVRTLNGLIPICSNCKRIRDDKGYWNHLEVYLSEHTDATMTHGICDACVQKYYPEIFEKRRDSAPGAKKPPSATQTSTP